MGLGGIAGDLVAGVQQIYLACGGALVLTAILAARSRPVRGSLAGESA